MEMIYDGTCGFCKRSMAWFLAFDGLRQIRIRDFRTDPSPIVSDDKLLEALYTVLPDGRALPGFEAYRYVVLLCRAYGGWCPSFTSLGSAVSLATRSTMGLPPTAAGSKPSALGQKLTSV